MENSTLLRAIQSDLGNASTIVVRETGASLSSYVSLITVLFFAAYLLPRRLYELFTTIFGTLAFFALMPLLIITTAIEMALLKTPTIYGVGGFYIAAIGLMWLFFLIRAIILYIKCGSAKVFIFGVSAVTSFTVNKGLSSTHYTFPGSVSGTGIIISVINGYARMATDTGSYKYKAAEVAAHTPTTLMVHTLTKTKVYVRQEEVINFKPGKDQLNQSSTSGIVTYMPTKVVGLNEVVSMRNGGSQESEYLFDS